MRLLLAVPAQMALAGVLGLSLGALAWDSGRPGDARRIAFEARIGWRFLLARGTPALSVVTRIAMVGVTLGVWLVLLSLAVLGGFERDLEDKIIGSGAHLRVVGRRGRPFVPPAALTDALDKSPLARATTPFVTGEVAIKSDSNYAAATLTGVVPGAATDVLAALADAPGGTRALVEPPAAPADDGAAGLPPMVLGVEIARILGVAVGDRVQAISPYLTSLTPIGPQPRGAAFVVAEILATGMYEFDARHAYIGVARARDFFDVEAREVSGLFVACPRADDAPRLARALAPALGEALVAEDWQARNQSLFSALKLERLVAFVVLVFIILVASFAIVNTLAMSVVEKRREIAILTTMGATRLSVAKIFMVQGLAVGGAGVGLGVGLGVASIALIARARFFLPKDVYYLESLPVAGSAMDVVQVALAALVIAWDFAVFPAQSAAGLLPVEGLRDG